MAGLLAADDGSTTDAAHILRSILTTTECLHVTYVNLLVQCNGWVGIMFKVEYASKQVAPYGFHAESGSCAFLLDCSAIANLPQLGQNLIHWSSY